MANNYEQATVEPVLPSSAVSDFERELLRGFGFASEPGTLEAGVKALYFFAEDSVNSSYFGDLTVGDVMEAASRGDSLAAALLKELGSPEADLTIDTFDKEIPSWENILQRILRKPECEGIDEIVVMAAYTCSKMRPGEFGGWVTRITRTMFSPKEPAPCWIGCGKETPFTRRLLLFLRCLTTTNTSNRYPFFRKIPAPSACRV